MPCKVQENSRLAIKVLTHGPLTSSAAISLSFTAFLSHVPGMFFGTTMVMVTVALVMAVVVTNIYAKKDSLTPPPRWLVNLAGYFYPAYLPENIGDIHSYRRRHSRSKGSHDYYGNHGNGRHSDVLSISDGELETLACSNSCKHGCKVRGSGDGGPVMAPTDRLDIEWRMIARFADRAFFWLFVVISTCTFTALFLKMIPPIPFIPSGGV